MDRNLEAAEHLAGLPCFNLYVGWRRIQAFYRRFLEAGVAPQRLYIFELLHAAGRRGMTVSELANHLAVDAASMSLLLSRMEAEDLLERRRDRAKKSQVSAHLTKKGAALRRRSARALETADDELAQAISPRDLAALRRIVATLDKL